MFSLIKERKLSQEQKAEIDKILTELEEIYVRLTLIWGKLKFIELVGLNAPGVKAEMPTIYLSDRSKCLVGADFRTIFIEKGKVSKLLDVTDPTHDPNFRPRLRDIILHEFGHYLHYVATKQNLKGGSHKINERSDKELAWSEGWAHFFSAALQKDPNHRRYFDWEEYKYWNNKLEEAGPDMEATVASILWNLYDGYMMVI